MKTSFLAMATMLALASGTLTVTAGNHKGNNGNNHDNHHFNAQHQNINHGNIRPGSNASRPGISAIRPGSNANRPTVQYRPGAVVNRPYRPVYAPVRNFYRPTPPASWRPSVNVNLWTNILGISVGMNIGTAVNRLSGNGYNVVGYGNEEIYLNNVSQYGYNWSDATMYYRNGGFVGSRFYHSTLAYNMNRYNEMFGYLTRMYGSPFTTSSGHDGASATWWGSGNQYITLDYGPMLTDSGQRYFTTLSIGI